MSNDEILERWRDAKLTHEKATRLQYGQTLYSKMAAEQAAIERFGLALHLQAYRRRFNEEPSS